jgi:hypothetical protein
MKHRTENIQSISKNQRTDKIKKKTYSQNASTNLLRSVTPLWSLYPSFARIIGSKSEIHCPHSCDRCENVKEVQEILLTEEELAREKRRKLVMIEAQEHQNSIHPLLKCRLCQAMEAMWRTQV